MEKEDLTARLARANPFERIVTLLMVVTGVAVVLAVGSGAIMRYLFRRDIYGIEELTTIAAFWMYFTGAVYAGKTRQLISAELVTIVTRKPGLLYAATLVQRLVTLAICVIFTWWGWGFLHWSVTGGGRTNLWQIPLWVGQSSVLFGLACLLVYFVRDVIMILRVKPSDYRPGCA
jgi:TRAP-type C4-dicarboxylate transport system permease small subunit